MPFIYYVKSGGAATGDVKVDSLTPRTGAWSATTSDYYDNINDVILNSGIVSGDYIFVSDVHTHTYTATTTINLVGGTSIISVSDTNQDTYSKGAVEQVTGTGHDVIIDMIPVNSTSYIKGLSFNSSDILVLVNASSGSTFSYEDCSFSLTGVSGGDTIEFGSKSSKSICKNCTFSFNETGQEIQIIENVHVTLIDCSILVTSAAITRLTDFQEGTLIIEGGDYTAMATGASIVDDIGNAVYAKITGALLPTSCILNTPIAGSGTVVEAASIGFGTTSDLYHYFYKSCLSGKVEEETSIYRTLGDTYDGVNGFSAGYTSTASAKQGYSVNFPIKNQYVDKADFTTNLTITVHMAIDGAATVLTTSEVFLEAVLHDVTDEAGTKSYTTEIDFLNGSNIATETGLWTGLGGTNSQMSLSLTIPLSEIASGSLELKVGLNKPSTTLYVCTKAELS